MLDAREIIELFGLQNVQMRGDEITCSCPFPENHTRGDKRPSFGISVSKGAYNCFSCGESGSLVTLAQKVLGMTRLEAMNAVYHDLTTEEALRMMGGERYVPSRVSPMEFDISKWSRNRHEYWRARGFNEETIGKWQLGYDPSENRVVVPIYFKKQLVGWTKRAVDDVTRPKWSHSPGIPKSQILFGMDNFVGESAILVEAPLSAIMLDQYGIKGAVASFGASLSDEQAVLLRNNYNNVLIFYDPDEAGMKGTARAIAKLEKFMSVYVVQPTRDDPAAMSREECCEAISGKPVIASWAWNMA
jgi:DNA primase